MSLSNQVKDGLGGFGLEFGNNGEKERKRERERERERDEEAEGKRERERQRQRDRQRGTRRDRETCLQTLIRL